jgi:hypothetical protein
MNKKKKEEKRKKRGLLTQIEHQDKIQERRIAQWEKNPKNRGKSDVYDINNK